MSRRRRTTVVLLLALFTLSVVAGVKCMPNAVSTLTYAAETGKAIAARDQLDHAADLSKGFQQVAKAARPSVVSISSVKRFKATPRQERQYGDLPEELSPFFDVASSVCRKYHEKDLNSTGWVVAWW